MEGKLTPTSLNALQISNSNENYRLFRSSVCYALQIPNSNEIHTLLCSSLKFQTEILEGDSNWNWGLPSPINELNPLLFFLKFLPLLLSLSKTPHPLKNPALISFSSILRQMDVLKIASAAGAAVAPVVGLLWEKIGEFADYKENAIKLTALSMELQAKLSDIEDDSHGVKLKTMNRVQNWIRDVQDLLPQAERYTANPEPSKNPAKRYSRSQDIVKLIRRCKVLNKSYFSLIQSADDSCFSDKLPLPPYFVRFSWYNEAFLKLMKTKNAIIAVEGGVGSGKSIFLHYLSHKMRQDYGLVIFIGPTVNSFEDLLFQIAFKLNLTDHRYWKESETEQLKTSLIANRLSKIDCVLIIDNLNFEFDFMRLGIDLKPMTKIIVGVTDPILLRSIFVHLHLPTSNLGPNDGKALLCSVSGLPYATFQAVALFDTICAICHSHPRLLYLIGLSMRNNGNEENVWLEGARLIVGLEKATGKLEEYSSKYDFGYMFYHLLCRKADSPFITFRSVSSYVSGPVKEAVDHVAAQLKMDSAKREKQPMGAGEITAARDPHADIFHIRPLNNEMANRFTQLLREHKGVVEKEEQKKNEDPPPKPKNTAATFLSRFKPKKDSNVKKDVEKAGSNKEETPVE